MKKYFTVKNILVAFSILFLLYSIIYVFVWSKKRTDEQVEASSWTIARKKSFEDSCFAKSEKAKEDPEAIRRFCACMTEKIVQKYSYSEMLELDKQPLEKQQELARQMSSGCVEELRSK